MTTPYERTRALVYAGDLLERLRIADSGDVPQSLRDQAHHILRHYPSNSEIAWMASDSQNSGSTMPMLDPDAVPPELRKGYRR